MYYQEETIEQVIAANDIVDVIGERVHLRRSGSSYTGLCPFHNEKTPSFSVHRGKQVFHCFGCGEGGNVITFLMKYENYSFQEALKVLADRAGIKLPEAQYSEGQRKRAQQRDELLAVNKEAATYYYRLLRSPKGRRGMDYFTNRALTGETLNRFGLGFADGAENDMVRHLRDQGFRDQAIIDSGIGIYDEKRGLHDRFFNRVMFPIMDVQNRVIGFGGRVLGDGKPKYLNSPETPVFDKSRNLYGLQIAKRTKAEHLILCEGYMDTIAMHQAGFDCAVASLGTSFTEGQAQLLKRYTGHVLLDYDSDGAGVTAAMRNMQILRAAGLPCKVIDMRPAKDADEFMQTEGLGPNVFRERIRTAEDSYYYQIRHIQDNYDLSDPSAKTQFQKETARVICGIDDEMERENYMTAIADRFLIPIDLLRRQVASYGIVGGETARSAESTRVDGSRVWNSGSYSGNKAQDGETTAGQMSMAGTAGTNARSIQGAGGASAHTGMNGRSTRGAGNRSALAALQKNERLLLTWLSDDPNIWPQIRQFISGEDFDEGTYRVAATKYFELLNRHCGDSLNVISGDETMVRISPAAVIAAFDDENEQREAASMFDERIPGIHTEEEREQALRDVLLAIKRISVTTSGEGSVMDLNKVIANKRTLAAIEKARFRVRPAPAEEE